MEPCTKQAFHSKREASKQAKLLRKIRGWKLRAYLCDDCGEYHLTSEPLDVYFAFRVEELLRGNG